MLGCGLYAGTARQWTVYFRDVCDTRVGLKLEEREENLQARTSYEARSFSLLLSRDRENA